MLPAAGVCQLILSRRDRIIAVALLVAAACLSVATAQAQEAAPSAASPAAHPSQGAAPAADALKIKILMARETRPDRLPPLSLAGYSARRRWTCRRETRHFG